MRKKPMVIAALIVVILLAVLMSAGPIYRYCTTRAFYKDKFDRNVWLAQNGQWDRYNPRGPMAGDVVRTVIRKGMIRTEVVRLLGWPDFRKQTDRYDYRLGSWGGCFLCSDILSIWFDKSGRVTETRICDD